MSSIVNSVMSGSLYPVSSCTSSSIVNRVSVLDRFILSSTSAKRLMAL